MTGEPRFATDPDTAAYYQRRAAEYDDWFDGRGRFAGRERPGWEVELAGLVELLGRLPPARTLDIACGTGYLTRHLPGLIVGLDQSAGMIELAQRRLVGGIAMVGDALQLPFAAQAFDRVVTAHFYGHLPESERWVFLDEARRVAGELIVVDSALRADTAPEQVQARVLNDGSTHSVFKRYLTAEQLAMEIGGTSLLSGRWFVAARSSG